VIGQSETRDVIDLTGVSWSLHCGILCRVTNTVLIDLILVYSTAVNYLAGLPVGCAISETDCTAVGLLIQ